MRLSIEVTEEQHAQLKACAASRGQSIEEYALKSLPGDADERTKRRLMIS